MVVFLFLISAEDVHAFNGYTNFTDTSKYWWNGSSSNPVYKYLGEYDLSADHEVNLYYTDQDKIDEILQAVYQQCLAWGITKNGAAAIVGNFRAEGAEPTITESYVDWSQFQFGKTGIGIMGFTWYSVQGDLFNTAYEMGKPWTDLGVQLKVFRDGYMHPDGDHAGQEEFYEEGHTIKELSDTFCIEYEKPQTNNTDTRYNFAQQYYDKFKDLEPKDYDGSLSGGSTSSSEGTAMLGTTEITKEWDLVGMPKESGLTADIDVPTLTSRSSLTTAEQYNLAEIGNNVSSTKEFNAWSTARVVVVFVGILMMIYALFMAMAVLFDNWNSFLNISLVSFLSLGAIHYSTDNIVLQEEGVKYTSTKRMIVLIAVMFLLAGILISGGVIPFILQALYNLAEAMSSSG